MKVRRLFALGVAASALFVSAGASAATILNGSFEDGAPIPTPFITVPGGDSTTITGWTVGGHSVDYIGSYWTAQDGSRSIDLAGSGIGSIFQTFATISGVQYNVGFWVGRNPDGGVNPRTGFVDAGGVATPITYFGGGNRANMQWQKETFTFTAAGPTTTLTFAADPSTSANFYGMALDNVTIQAVPEPATWAMMILGFGLVGGAMRQTRRRRGALALA